MLVEITDFTGVSISPDGKYVAYRQERASVDKDAYQSEWVIEPLAGGVPRAIGDGGAPIFTSGWALGEWPRWSSDSRWLYFRALHGEEVQVWRLSIDGELEKLTDDPSDVRSFELLSDDALAYEVGPTREAIKDAELNEYDNGILIDKSTPIGQPLFRSGAYHGRLVSERYLGKWMGRTTLLGDEPTQVKVLQRGTHQTRDANQVEERAFRRRQSGPSLEGAPGRSERMNVAIDRRIAYVPEDSKDGERALRAKLTKRGADTICDDPACSRRIAWLSWRGARREVIFATVDYERGNAMTIFSWDVDRNRVRTVLAAPGLVHSGRVAGIGEGCAINDRYAVCVAADADTPPRIVRIDLDSGRAKVLADPNDALAAALGNNAEFVRWKDRKGRLFTGFFLPAEGEKRPSPAFITYYTCQGYLRGGFGDEWPLAAFAKAGIATLCINMRPLADSDLSAIREYQVALDGIKSAVDMLATRGVDRRKIGIGGFSFGAEVAMWVAYHSNLIAAASLATPQLNEAYYWQRALMGKSFKETLRKTWGLGAPDETPKQWRRLSPTYNLDHLRFPLLMQLPEEEYLVAPAYFTQLIDTCAPTEVYVFPHEPHYKEEPRHRLAIYRRNLDWFRFWLLNDGGDANSDGGEIARWRRLRERMHPKSMGAADCDLDIQPDRN